LVSVNIILKDNQIEFNKH